MTKLISTKYTKGQYANQTITLPVVGNVVFDSDGNVEVPSDKAQAVLLATKDSFAFKVQASVPPATPPATKLTKEEARQLEKKSQAEQENIIKQNLANEVVGKEPVQLEVGEVGIITGEQLTEEQQQIKDQLEQADLATLIELASDLPQLAEKELAGMTDVQLRQELLKAMTSEQ